MAARSNKRKKTTVAEDVADMRRWQTDHGRQDDERHQENIQRFADGSKKMDTLTTKDDLADFAKIFVETDEKGEVKFGDDGKMIPRFALKTDVAPVKAFYDKLALSAQIVDGAGKGISKTVFWLAAFLLAVGIITGKIWVLLAWLAGSAK